MLSSTRFGWMFNEPIVGLSLAFAALAALATVVSDSGRPEVANLVDHRSLPRLSDRDRLLIRFGFANPMSSAQAASPVQAGLSAVAGIESRQAIDTPAQSNSAAASEIAQTFASVQPVSQQVREPVMPQTVPPQKVVTVDAPENSPVATSPAPEATMTLAAASIPASPASVTALPETQNSAAQTSMGPITSSGATSSQATTSQSANSHVAAHSAGIRLELQRVSARAKVRTRLPLQLDRASIEAKRDTFLIGPLPAGVTLSKGRPVDHNMWQVAAADGVTTDMIVDRRAPAQFDLTFMLLDSQGSVVNGVEMSVAVLDPPTALASNELPVKAAARQRVKPAVVDYVLPAKAAPITRHREPQRLRQPKPLPATVRMPSGVGAPPLLRRIDTAQLPPQPVNPVGAPRWYPNNALGWPELDKRR